MALKRTTKVLSETGMSSMTDLVFLLLIFFLLTSTLVNPNALKLLLPKSTGQVSDKATVSVSVKDWHQDNKFTYPHQRRRDSPALRAGRGRTGRTAADRGRPYFLYLL